eukprot:TRINITY_DN1301_c0_g1_i1.p1 TRINITY_DN1301_c0_g1~~TRINITY_DN1301_c0_g1_i1.p1  ORF type:complete len:407 (+),score=63.04 TRINITY_DN1301_c0_g1_i1:233-1453(+)
MPLTQKGYRYLGLTIARNIRAFICKPRWKVIAVDADYTLWTGECAHGLVKINKGNFALQEFLLHCKEQGVLLVILSKNSKRDVEKVFETQSKQMTLKKEDFVKIVANWREKSDNIRWIAKQLNLGIDNFVFIDDSPIECEKMLLSVPEVLTVPVPKEEHLVGPLLQNLWTFDMGKTTSEASERTELYRIECIRQKEMQSRENSDRSFRKANIYELLTGWKMHLIICKTSVGDLKQNKTLCTRAEELLLRTNQFKMNDVKISLNEVPVKSNCWLVALKDCYGAYGIISVCLLSIIDMVVYQWVVSCRVLGREVEKRIIYEIWMEASKTSRTQHLRLFVSKTVRNTPMTKFLVSLGATITESQMRFTSIHDICLEGANADIHTVENTNDLDFFEDNVCSKSKKEKVPN